MNNKILIVIVIICWLIIGTSLAQTSNKKDYKIRSNSGNLIVTFERKSHILNVADKIDAAKITETEILFASRKENFTYLVVAVSGQSKEKEDDRQCGAGTEANLLWIKLDNKWRVSDINSIRHESCWSAVSSFDGYKVDSNLLKIEFDNIRDKISVKLTYNADEPQKGFQIEQTALELPE